METKKLRVIVIGTGNIAGIAIRCLQGRKDLELVGVWGRSKNIGLDAGLLDTDLPCGVIITDNAEEIFALKPDCAVMALNTRDPVEAQKVNGPWFVKLLESGINVVTASDGGLVYPPAHVDQAYVADLEGAAQKGKVAFYMNGQEPGFVEHMALLCATLSNTIKRITSYELFNYSSIKAREEMSFIFGFDDRHYNLPRIAVDDAIECVSQRRDRRRPQDHASQHMNGTGKDRAGQRPLAMTNDGSASGTDDRAEIGRMRQSQILGKPQRMAPLDRANHAEDIVAFTTALRNDVACPGNALR